MKKFFLSLVIAASFTSCGASNSSSSSKELPGPVETLLGKTKYTVQALVINESSAAIDVALLNNGPHAGGCDSKNYVPLQPAAKKISTLSDTWYCEIDQKFSILVKHPKGDLTIDGASASVICSDEGCRKLDVK